ncbi:MarR family winged helix-turn-helix transcriptional regulator [Nocardioides nematodiphilus]|uniref:MarR family winged helix-turn-helix transcriptional regulator n=1 Tax=Nocardioides nematodiphilus TaxID=2849669 RepID=UPI001CD94E95|nr:MarR family transcriptional regulator [Nocardioides nematodiphilus]MCA1981714.1 MarR family transcriptional regulator [Nocardioides nematodiphilus]
MASTSAPAVRRRFFDDLVRCETRLYNAVGERLRAEHGIVASQFEMLRYLRDHPGARVAEMASTFAAGIGAISKGVDRLTARGWATREPNPADGRSSLIVLTDDGAALVAEAERTFDRVLADLVGPTLDEEELAAGASALAALRRALEAARVGVPTG